jgi:hypothetical protein
MRKFGIVAGCVGLALLVSGCDPNDRMYFRGGIGTDLYTPDAALATDLQNAYLENLCRQSLPFVGAGVPSCSQQELSPTAWPLIVQAGMNDIDQRCDAYLSWLDQKKREQGAILAEIGAIRVAVDALTNPAISTGISPIALAAVAAAFGLATSTLGNVNSLLIQVDHTTVQSVVFMNRRAFREDIRNLAIVNKPTVVHALRSYLQICMPMTIAANINSTVTVFQNTGGNVPIRQMVAPPVAPPMVPVVARPVAAAPAPATVRTAVNAPSSVAAPKFSDVYRNYLEAPSSSISNTYVEGVLRALCVDKSDFGSVPKVKDLISAYEAGVHQGSSRARANGLLDAAEMRDLNSMGACPADFRNAYERITFPSATAMSLAGPLSRVSGVGPVAENTPLRDLRSKIKLARQALKLSDPLVPDQITPDLFDKLEDLPKP